MFFDDLLLVYSFTDMLIDGAFFVDGVRNVACNSVDELAVLLHDQVLLVVLLSNFVKHPNKVQMLRVVNYLL